MTLGMNIFKFIGGTKPILDKPAFIEMDYATVRNPPMHLCKRKYEFLTLYRLRVVPVMLDLSATNNRRWRRSYEKEWQHWTHANYALAVKSRPYPKTKMEPCASIVIHKVKSERSSRASL